MPEEQTPTTDVVAPPDGGTTIPAAPPADADATPPAWPDKFRRPDGTEDLQAMSTAYHGLEHRLATTKRVPASGRDTLSLPGDAEIPKALPENATSADHLQGMGLDENVLANQFATKGHLLPKQYEILASHGLHKVFVDKHYANELKIAQRDIADARKTAIGYAGGEKQLQTLLDWREQDLSETEFAALQARLQHPDTMLSATKEIWADHQRAVGANNTQPLIPGGGAAAASTGGYTSQAEWLKANNDPRYETDNAYRATVDARADKTDVKIIHGFPTT